MGWICDKGQCIPLDQRWHEPIVIADPRFFQEGIVLDTEDIPLSGVDIFVQDRLTPLKTKSILNPLKTKPGSEI
jgi:hypothetical protein